MFLMPKLIAAFKPRYMAKPSAPKTVEQLLNFFGFHKNRVCVVIPNNKIGGGFIIIKFRSIKIKFEGEFFRSIQFYVFLFPRVI